MSSFICTLHDSSNPAHQWSIEFDGTADELLDELEYVNQRLLDDDDQLFYTVVPAH